MYTLYEIKGGWRLRLKTQGIIRAYDVERYIDALRIIQALRLHLKPYDRLLAV